MTWLDEPLIALDTETTGTDPETARIVTACIGLAAQPGAWAPRQWLINPGVPIPAEATAIHGITQEAAGRGADPRVALAEIAAVLSDCARGGVPVVIFNASYDLTLLDREFRRHLGAELPLGLLVLDTLVLFRRFDLTTGGDDSSSSRHAMASPSRLTTRPPMHWPHCGCCTSSPPTTTCSPSSASTTCNPCKPNGTPPTRRPPHPSASATVSPPTALTPTGP